MFEVYDEVSAESSSDENRWYVYLLPLLDCTVFKIGFTANPLRRIFSFNRRYFERFDLQQSLLLEVHSNVAARATEAALKEELSEFQAAAPSWVALEAGGHTEWFSSVHFPHAEERLRSFAGSGDSNRLNNGADHLRTQLGRSLPSFEGWACAQAQRLRDNWVSVSLGYESSLHTNTLRDWLDAYEYFSVPLFEDDPMALEFVAQSVRLLRI